MLRQESRQDVREFTSELDQLSQGILGKSRVLPSLVQPLHRQAVRASQVRIVQFLITAASPRVLNRPEGCPHAVNGELAGPRADHVPRSRV